MSRYDESAASRGGSRVTSSPGAAMTGSLGTVGEFGMIEAITANLPGALAVDVGPGDDAAVVRTPDRRVVTSCDMFVERVHFRTDWSSGTQIGRKAALASMADIAAMGAIPTALVVGLAAPADTPATLITDMGQGLAHAADEYGASLVGGDLTRADQIVLSVTVLGDLAGGAPILRSGARAGDIVALAGRLGWAAAGLAVLGRGFRSPAAVVGAHHVPDPPLGAGPLAFGMGVHAMTDVSDGLLADLGHIAEASKVSVDLDPDALPVPDKLAEVASVLGADAMTWLLTGGEDHALVATFPADADLSDPWRPIGHVSAPSDQHGSGTVTVDGTEYDDIPGFEHFR